MLTREGKKKAMRFERQMAGSGYTYPAFVYLPWGTGKKKVTSRENVFYEFSYHDQEARYLLRERLLPENAQLPVYVQDEEREFYL